jgi:hypothetical protein
VLDDLEGGQSKMSTFVTMTESKSAEEYERKQSVFVPDDRKYHEGIYWLSPITMLVLLLIGISASVGHHTYYSSLDGKVVGNDTDQQWKLRYLIISIIISFFQ